MVTPGGERIVVRPALLIPELAPFTVTTDDLGHYSFAGVPTVLEDVQVRVSDGALGWPEAAPFDAILVSAAPREVPPALLDQLAPGGRLVLPVGPSPEQQELQLWRRLSSGGLEKRGLMQVRFVPLIGSSQRSAH